MPETSILIIVLALLMQCSVAGMTDAEELEFLGLWLIDIGKSMRDLSAAVQQCYERLFR